MEQAKPTTDISHFTALDIRVGTIIAVYPFPEARKPAWRLTLDMGPAIGQRQSSAQLTALYDKQSLLGRQVLVVVNLPPKQVGPFISECLVLGVYAADQSVVLVQPDQPIPNGSVLG